MSHPSPASHAHAPLAASQPRASPPSQVTAGVVNALVAGAFWGLIFLIPLLLPDFNAWQLSAARYLVYGCVAVLLLAPRWRRLRSRLGRQELLGLLGLSMLGNIVYYVLLVWGVQWAGAAPTTLIIGLIPVLVTLFGTSRQGAIGLRPLLAPLALCLLGTSLVAAQSLLQGSPATATLSTAQRALGLLAASGALLSWSAYSIYNSHWLRRRPDISPWDWSLLTGLATGLLSLGLAVPAFLAPWVAPAAGDSAHTPAQWLYFWLLTGTLAILASVVGNNFWNRASRQLPLTMIGQMIVFETVFGLVYGFLYDWRLPSMLEWLAMTALIAGVLWCARVHQRQHRGAA